MLQALIAGNAVLVKPAPGCSPHVATLRDLLVEACLPQDLCHVLDEDNDTVQAMITVGVDKVVLTGSAATGRRLLADLAPHLTPTALELSGNGAVFVLPDADLEQVAAALAFGLSGSDLRFRGGQGFSCDSLGK
jgi:acyl-CoA reductase-like NAD-dependent aldehyde dehydrogenase